MRIAAKMPGGQLSFRAEGIRRGWFEGQMVALDYFRRVRPTILFPLERTLPQQSFRRDVPVLDTRE